MNQEEIVDNIILDMLEIKYPGIKKKVLTDTKKSKRRSGMLAFLGDDKELFSGYKNIVDNNPQRPCAQYSKDILNMLREYVKIADVEVKRFGEVMTPFTLVDDMLNALPDDVWLNPNLKWLDPCNGIGTFPCIIVDRLMVGLKDVIPNDCDRYKHIIENMIYVCELQVKNMFLYHCAFDREDNYALNTYCGSFLDEKFDEHMKNVWGVEKFDIVVANPPYQTQREGDRKTQPLWHLFVNKSINVLIEGGHLNMVHPSGWRNVDGAFKETQKNILSNDVLYLEIHNEKDGIKTFGAETRYDFYCLRKSSENVLTRVVGQSGKEFNINLKGYDFIPNDNFDKVYSLIAKNKEECVNVMHSSSSYETRKNYMSRNKENTHIYPCIYTIKNKDIPTFYFSSNNQKGHFGISKLIWSNGRIISVGSYIDKNGNYGLTQFSSAIVDTETNLPNIKMAFDSKEFRSLMEDCAVSDMSINRKVIATFRKDFYKQFLND
jgi:hypothetical protein